MGTTLKVPEYGAAPWMHWGHGCHACCLAGPSKDAASEAVYEELDYSLMPEYQEVPSHTGGSGMVPGPGAVPIPCHVPNALSPPQVPYPRAQAENCPITVWTVQRRVTSRCPQVGM